MINRLIDDKSGSAFVMTMLIILVFMILGFVIFSAMSTELKLSIYYNHKIQSYYYAKTGAEVAQVLANDISFDYLYGSLEEGLTGGKGEYEDENNSILVFFSTTNDSITITSKGTKGNAEDLLTYSFIYSPEGGEPVPPPDGVGNAGPEDEGGIGWHDEDGRITPGQPNNRLADETIIFDNDTVIYNNQNSSTQNPFEAPAMFFMHKPVSLIVERSITLALKTDFVAFLGEVDGQEHNNKKNYGKLLVATKNSEIDGATIGGKLGEKYGVVYIGGTIKNSDTNLTGYNPGSYYYFPSGINLTNQNELDKLILIDDLSLINFESLGYSFSTGLSPGIYQ